MLPISNSTSSKYLHWPRLLPGLVFCGPRRLDFWLGGGSGRGYSNMDGNADALIWPCDYTNSNDGNGTGEPYDD